MKWKSQLAKEMKRRSQEDQWETGEAGNWRRGGAGGRVLRSQKAKGKVKRNFKRQQMISTINAVEKLIQLRTELYPQYLAAWVDLATILGQLMQIAITNKSLSDSGLYSGHLLLNPKMVQSRYSWLARSFSYSETRFLLSASLYHGAFSW